MKHVEFKTINKQRTFGIFFSIFVSIYFCIYTIRYFVEAIETNYTDYIFSLSNLTFVSVLVIIIFFLKLSVTKHIEYDNNKIRLSKHSFFSDKHITVNYQDIKKITNKLGIVSIRTKNKILIFDFFFYEKKDIKKLLEFLGSKTSSSIINPKANTKELLLGIFFLTLLFGLYAFIYLVIKK